MRRTEARELFMQLLFQMEVQENYGPQLKERFVEDRLPQSSQLPYFNQMYQLVHDNLKEIDAAIENSSSNWKIKRLAKVDLAILRLAIAELFYMEDIPDSASINEAVDLAKKFGSEDSGKFVNGVLGKIARGKHE